MWYHHAQIIWMKECREDFHYKKNWITSKMMCTFKWVSPQTLPYLHSLEKKKFFLCAGKTLMPVKATVEAPWWGSTPQVADMNRFHWPPQFNSSLQIVHWSPQIFNWSLQIVQLVPSQFDSSPQFNSSLQIVHCIGPLRSSAGLLKSFNWSPHSSTRPLSSTRPYR